MIDRFRKLAQLAVLVVMFSGAAPAAERPSSIRIEGESFGAVADERGPIGGGPGYAAVVTHGDHVAADAESLIAALAAAKSGDVVFIPGERPAFAD